ncbi:hypothetical protein ASG31_16515 [Chryseobacterium sp. Leaf404]|uniref:hypothetical protein n=1 Tax=unclassified Chryseobacterium TaxID=2593645 RepID=UPI0006FE79A9|nr:MULTISPECIES: hypothetical protein [unclassified Chryseobacterium]KQT21478.1 hypothetical protein ASG31_16515 [Chryseobacterium sp. Leaf404]
MENIKIIIERSDDFFWAYAENVKGITAGGDTVKDVKKSILESIAINKELGNFPKEECELTYRYDIQSFLNYYKGILSNPAMEKITGINQKQIHHYATGLKKPRAAQRKKIEEGLHRLGKELLSIEL